MTKVLPKSWGPKSAKTPVTGVLADFGPHDLGIFGYAQVLGSFLTDFGTEPL